ncbi:hypothetical protein ACQEVZ_40095 [Dactylosporangium sp. CA-152071]|uniref:hypothetical protein n=1 Tax=Dactylosporangium sp. CA-152071 TaxID=3239933 RepID=UPI003D8CCF94
MPVGHPPIACPDKASMPTPSGSLLLTALVSKEQAGSAVRYALGPRTPQTDEVRIIIAEAALLQAPMLPRYLGQLPPSIREASFIDAVIAEPPPEAGTVMLAANTLALPIEVRHENADGFAEGVFEFRDGFGPVPRVLADRVRVFPADTLDEATNPADHAARRIGARFGVVPGSEAGTYGLGHGWVVQVFEWGLWVRPDGVTDGVVAGVVAGVEQRVAGEVGRGGAAPRPLVLLGESGGGTVPDVVLDRLEEARRVLPRRVVARLRVEWLGARPPSRVIDVPDTVDPAAVSRLAEQHGIPVGRLMALVKEAGLHPLHLAVLLPGAGAGLGAVLSLDGLAGGWERELDRLAGSVGLGYRWLRGMLADLGVPLGDVASGDVGGLVAQWVGLLLGGDAGFEEGSVVSVVNLIEQEVDAAGLDRAGIEAVAGVTGVSGAVVSALSLRFGRVPVELVTADRDGRVTLLAARLGVDPAVLLADSGLLGLLGAPALPPYSVVGPAGAARVTALMLREDPVWSAAHPPEQVFGVRLMDVVRRASVLGLAVEEVAPFVDWLAGQGRDLDGLAAGSSELVRLRQEWLAAEFHVRPGDIDDDEDVRPWLVHHEGLRLARRLRVAPQVVRQAALAADDLPVDLDEVAERLGVSAEALWNLAFDLDLDPWALEPILAGRSRSARLVVADVRADVDEWTALLGVSDRIALAFLRDTRRTSTDLGRTTINDLDAWAAVILGVDVEVARGYRERLGRRYLDPVLWAADGFTRTPGEVVRAAHASGVSPYWLAAASVRAGLPFTGLARAARRLEVDPLQLLAVAAALGVDPDTLRGWHGLGHRLNGPQPAGDRYGAARALADELRGDRHLHPAGPDGDRVLKLLLDALPPLTGNERHVVTKQARTLMADGHLNTTSVAWSTRWGLIPVWADEWAQRLGQSPEEVTRDLHRFVWLSPQAVEAVAAVIGEGTDPVEVWRFAVRVGRMPDDLHRIAERSNIRRSELFQMAVAFDADPRDLTPVVAVYDKDRPLADQIAEWVTWFDRWTDVRPDRGLLMTALHDTDMTVQWDGSDEELRDIVDSWIATTLGQDVEAFREAERAGPIDLRASWRLVEELHPPLPQSTPITDIAERLGASAVWLRGVMLALATELSPVPELTPEEADLLRADEPAGWWSVVRRVAADIRLRLGIGSNVQPDVHSRPGRPPAGTVAEALLIALPLASTGLLGQDVLNLHKRVREKALDVWDLSPQVRTWYAEYLTVPWHAASPARVRLLTELAAVLSEARPVPGLSEGQTVRVVHAGVIGAGGLGTSLDARLYMQFAVALYNPTSIERRLGGPPAPESARLSRALGFDRTVEVLDGSHRAPTNPLAYEPYLDDKFGTFIDTLLAEFPDGGFLRLGALESDPAHVFDGVVRHLATTDGARGIVLYRTSPDGTGAVRAGVLNAFRGPSGEIVFLDPLTLLPAVLPSEGPVDVLFLPTGGQQPSDDVTPVDPRTDPSWPDQLRDWAEALGLPRIHVQRAFVDAGLTATWSGDLEAARALVDAWQAHVLGVTGVPPSEAERIQQLTGRLARLAGWSDEAVTETARRLGVSLPWFRTTVLLAGVGPAELPGLADWPADMLVPEHWPAPAPHRVALLVLLARLGPGPRDVELTGAMLEQLTERGPNGWHEAVEAVAAQFPPPRRRAPWAEVLRLLPHISDDVTDEQLEALRAALAQDGVAIAALPEPVQAAYAATVFGDTQALVTALLPRVAEHGVAHAASGPATPAERRLYVGRLQLPLLRVGNEDLLARAVELDTRRRTGEPGRRFRELARIADVVGRYPASGGFVRFLDGAARRVPGIGGLVRHIAGTGDAGIVLHRSLDGAGRAHQRVLYAFNEQGTVVLVDPDTLQLAELPAGGPADVLFLPTGGQVAPGARTEPVDTDADWPDTLAELFLPPLRLPDGVAELDGGALLVGEPTGNRQLWTEAARLAGALRRPLVIVDKPNDAAAARNLQVLLERLRLRGRVPVIFAFASTWRLRHAGSAFGASIVHQAAGPTRQSGLRLDNVWAVTGPGLSEPSYHGETLTERVFSDASNKTTSAPPAPPMLATWLDAWARDDREESRTVLAKHPTELTSQAVLDWIQEMIDRSHPVGVRDSFLYKAVIELAKLDQADLAYRFLDAPDVATKVEVALSAAPERLPEVTNLLAELGLATYREPADMANAEVLSSLHTILTKERPKTKWFRLDVIKHLTTQDKVLWADRLSKLSEVQQFSPKQEALLELRDLTLTC